MPYTELPELTVIRHEPDMTRLWLGPPGARTFPLRESSTGHAPRLRTDLTLFRNDRNLYVLFSMEDDEVVASMFERDAPLWTEDVVEVFLAPNGIDEYYELEVSPHGTLFDARIQFPGPDRSTMKVDANWHCPGFHGAVRRVRSGADHRADVLVTIPFASIVGKPPATGQSWRANFYRIDRSPRGDSFSAWSPTGTPSPDFHVPSKFGLITF